MLSLSLVQSGGSVLQPGTGQRLKGKSFAGEAVQAGRQDCFRFPAGPGESHSLRTCPSGAHIHSKGKQRIKAMEAAGCLTAPTEPGPVIRGPGCCARTVSYFTFTTVLLISMRLNRRNSERGLPPWTKDYPREWASLPVRRRPHSQFTRTLSPQPGYECRGVMTFRAIDFGK
jgi:hypothetical protein